MNDIKSYDQEIKDLPAYCEKTVIRFDGQGVTEHPLKVLSEEPLSIRVQGKPYAVIMRTPGHEIPHVAGFCLGEGIIDAYHEIKQIAFCDGADTNTVTVTLDTSRLSLAAPILERRGFISQSSCGICGKEVVRDLIQSVRPIEDNLRFNWERLLECIHHFSNNQSLYRTTRTSHAALAFDSDFKPLAVGEDVGRHNAVDKAIGRLLIEERLTETMCMMLSSRISYELIQKVARARIPVLMAMSRPTTLAVELAEKLNITIVCAPKNDGLTVYSGRQRLNNQ
ncbi:MAG: formate dehydrogenase accessory sulfurtransferase FdhD [Desulfobacteraceae bacterium]